MTDTVEYVFKLRSNIDLEGDLELAAMELDALLDGDVDAVADITSVAEDLPELGKLTGFEALDSHVRNNGKQAFRASGHGAELNRLVERLSFVQRIYAVGAPDVDPDLSDGLDVVSTAEEIDGSLVVQAVPHYAVLEVSDVVARRSSGATDTKDNLDATVATLLGRTNEGSRLVDDALGMKNTSGLLSHDVHYYKAKFFPRMARSIINTYGESPKRVIDNFVGSGTALLEASLLGVESVGYDIDPLSVLISNTKLRALDYDSGDLEREVERVEHWVEELAGSGSAIQSTISEYGGEGGTKLESALPSPDEIEGIAFPDWLMANRKMTDERATELGHKIGILQFAVANSDPRYRDLFRVLLSDAIARKIKFRFLGTGVGRFSLNFTKTPMERNFLSTMEKYVKVAAVSEWAQENLDVEYADAVASRGDARELPTRDGEFDFLVTSPPYLPASSGRESYAKARAPSLVALGMFEPEEIADLAGDAVGSMDPEELPLDDLTDRERDLVEWLLDDDLREIKGAPTAHYFTDMRETFEEMYRVLESGSKAVVVSGKQSTFYESESREPLYVAEAAEMLADEAETAGFDVVDLHDIQLQKPNKNARPRSLDDYYETLIVLEKPEQGGRPSD